MKCTKPSVLVVLVPTLAVALGVSRSAGSQGQASNGEVTLSVEGPRPLAEAAKLLELKLGVGVSYEDVPLVYSGDYARASDTSWGRKYGDDHKEFKTVNPISFIGGTLQIQFQIDPRTTKPIASASRLLQDVIDQHSARKNPGEFTLATVSNDFSIVPTAARDRSGKMVAVRSPLDFPISFPVAERTGMETLRIFCDAVTMASGYRVGVGTIPLNMLRNTVVRLGANGELARDVLVKMLQELSWSDPRTLGPIPKLSWQLLYGLEAHDIERGFYALNLGAVEREEPTRVGTIRRVRVLR